MDLTVGQKASRSLTLTAEHVEKYAEITGDYNPLHFDEAFCGGNQVRQARRPGRFDDGDPQRLGRHGHAGPGTVFLSHDFKFTAPVFIDDIITGEAEVLSVHASKPVTQLKITITRQTGETVLEGVAWCYTMSPEMSPRAAS